MALNFLGFFFVRQLGRSRRREFYNFIKVQETEAKYRQLIDHAAEGIVVIQEERLVLVNPEACRLMDYSKEEILGQPVTRFLYPEDAQRMMEIHRLRTAGEPMPDFYEARLRAKHGQEVWVEVSGVPLIWEDKPAALNFLADISARRQARAEERELAKLQGAMEMAGAASHQMNQPLQAMTSNLELLQMAVSSGDPSQGKLEALAEGLERLRKISSQIQGIHRYETMEYDGRHRIIDIDKASQ